MGDLLPNIGFAHLTGCRIPPERRALGHHERREKGKSMVYIRLTCGSGSAADSLKSQLIALRNSNHFLERRSRSLLLLLRTVLL